MEKLCLAYTSNFLNILRIYLKVDCYYNVKFVTYYEKIQSLYIIFIFCSYSLQNNLFMSGKKTSNRKD